MAKQEALHTFVFNLEIHHQEHMDLLLALIESKRASSFGRLVHLALQDCITLNNLEASGFSIIAKHRSTGKEQPVHLVDLPVDDWPIPIKPMTPVRFLEGDIRWFFDDIDAEDIDDDC